MRNIEKAEGTVAHHALALNLLFIWNICCLLTAQASQGSGHSTKSARVPKCLDTLRHTV